MTLRVSRFFGCLVVLLIMPGCSHRQIRPSMPTDVARTDNSYLDLEPGWELRVVVPLLKSGGFHVHDLSAPANNSTLSASSEDFIGYRVFHYTISGRTNSVVRLKFLSAEVTRNGATIVEPHPPALPFALPTQTGHIRLVYLVRVSEADHNMAIIASRRLEALNVFTKQFEKNPNACAISNEVFCAWVPAGIALRPEKSEAAR